MNILILGSGMYVTGRNSTGTGTVLSSLAQTSKSMKIEEVLMISKSKSSEANVAEAAQRINKKLNSKLNVRFVLLEDDFNKQFIVELGPNKRNIIRIDKKKTTPLLVKAGRLLKKYKNILKNEILSVIYYPIYKYKGYI